MLELPKQRRPNANLSMSATAKQKLKKREKPEFRYYNDGGGNKGNCTFGYGQKIAPRPCTPEELNRKVTKEMAERFLSNHIKDVENSVRRAIRIPLNQDQFDALVSYAYNTGARGAEDVFSAINANNFPLAIKTMRARIYSRQDGKLVLMPGLILRREVESAPFEAVEP